MPTTDKVILPVQPSPETMSLLIKAHNLLSHANKHAVLKSDFDIMLAIHSLDNAIEYILRIIIRHLDIEETLGKTIDTMELMGLFGDVNNYLKKYTLYAENQVFLPYKNEIRQLRVLRNNVQHGMILPINELKDISKYANRFFEKILQKVFGLSLNEISYATLIKDEKIREYIQASEREIKEEKYLDSIISARDAFELGRFIFSDNSHNLTRSPALASIKYSSLDLYYYLSQMDDELFVLSSKINMEDYRKFVLYLDHIPSEHNARNTGYRLLQREWERYDAVFCCNFVSNVILSWQLDEVHPLYEIDISDLPIMNHAHIINGTKIPEIYPEKGCIYAHDGNLWGELFYVGGAEKDAFDSIRPDHIIKYETHISNKAGAMWRSYSDYRKIHTIDSRVILNKNHIWEIVMFYELIPFTEVEENIKCIDLDELQTTDNVDDFEDRPIIISFLEENGAIDSIEKAFELNKCIKNNSTEYHLVSTGLINILSEQALSSKIISV